MTDVFLVLPMQPDQRVRELHAWVATHQSGAEGIIAALIGNVLSPLVTSKPNVARGMEALARQAAAMSQAGTDPAVRVRLATYRLVEASA